MNIQPTLHWNNFTVPELKEILEHCVALERLGIAQDEEMMCSIERDITLREKKTPSATNELKPAKTRQKITIPIKSQQLQEYPVTQIA
jgi:hypothetical protein